MQKSQETIMGIGMCLLIEINKQKLGGYSDVTRRQSCSKQTGFMVLSMCA